MTQSCCLVLALLLACQDGLSQTRLDFPQQVKGLPGVVMIQRSICVPAVPTTTSNCTGMELYSLLFANGTQRIMIGVPDDGNISQNAQWTPVPLTPPGTTGTAVSFAQVRAKVISSASANESFIRRLSRFLKREYPANPQR